MPEKVENKSSTTTKKRRTTLTRSSVHEASKISRGTDMNDFLDYIRVVREHAKIRELKHVTHATEGFFLKEIEILEDMDDYYSFKFSITRLYIILEFPLSSNLAKVYHSLSLFITFLIIPICIFITVEEVKEYITFVHILSSLRIIICFLFMCESILKLMSYPIFDIMNLILNIFDVFVLIVFQSNMDMESIYGSLFPMFRCYRLFNLSHLLGYSIEVYALKVIWHEGLEFIFIVYIFFMVFAIGFSSLCYVVELVSMDSGLENQPITLYWTVTILTSLGLNDISFVNPMTQFLTCFALLLSPFVFALLTAVISNSYSEYKARQRAHEIVLKARNIQKMRRERPEVMHDSMENTTLRYLLSKNLDMLFNLSLSRTDYKTVKDNILTLRDRQRYIEMKALAEALQDGNFDQFSDIFYKYSNQMQTRSWIKKKRLYFGPLMVGLFRKRIYKFFEHPSTTMSKGFKSTLMFVVVLSICSTFIASLTNPIRSILHMNFEILQQLYEKNKLLYEASYASINILFPILFMLEYMCRFAVQPDLMDFLTQPTNLIELLCFFPYLLIWVVAHYLLIDFNIVMNGSRTIFLLEALTILKLLKHFSKSTKMQTVLTTLVYSSSAFISYLMLMLMTSILLSFFIYFFEMNVPHTEFADMIIGIYWSLGVLSTNGQSSLKVATAEGQIIAMIGGLMAITIIAMPIITFEYNFQKVFRFLKFRKQIKMKLFPFDTPEYFHMDNVRFVDALNVTVKMMEDIMNIPPHLENTLHAFQKYM